MKGKTARLLALAAGALLAFATAAFAGTILGTQGNDYVNGGQSADTLTGGAGDDILRGRGDGNTADQISCGDGADTVIADRNDVVTADCETVLRNGGNGHGEGHAKGPKKPHPVHPVS